MKASEFCYWLQGHLEIGKVKALDEEQVKVIRRHLALVFKHDLDGPDPDGTLQATHDGGGGGGLPSDVVFRC